MNDDLFLSIQNIIDHSDKISFSIDGVTESIKDDLEKIIDDFYKRNRRFGSV